MGPYNPASGMPPTRWPRQPQDFEPSLLAYYQVAMPVSGFRQQKGVPGRSCWCGGSIHRRRLILCCRRWRSWPPCCSGLLPWPWSCPRTGSRTRCTGTAALSVYCKYCGESPSELQATLVDY